MNFSFIRIFLIIIILIFNLISGQEWIRRYDGPASNFDIGLDLALDQSGNCYVTGYSMNASFNYDFATLKYSNSGIEKWLRCFDGTGNGDDFARVIKLNRYHQIYVAGSSFGNGTDLDFLIIRYDTSGNLIWFRQYDKGANHTDEAFDLTTDDLGNIYVTGYATDTSFQRSALTIKYDTSGTIVWVKCYAGPPTFNNLSVKIKLDNWHNVYVAGYGSDTSGWNDYFVVKYDSAGNQAWVTTYNSPANRNDYLRDLQIDSLGNIYVTGYSEGENNFDCATVKYNSSGNQRWVQRYNGEADLDDRGYRIAFDQYQNVYVIGYSNGIDTRQDYITLKYDSAGNELWQRRYNGSGNRDDVAKALVVDEQGNCYVTGHSYFNQINIDDYLTIKYDSAGNLISEINYNGSGSGYDEPYQLILQPNGNLLVTGESFGINTAADYATISFRAVGIEEAQPEKIKFEPSGFSTLIMKQHQSFSFAEKNYPMQELKISIYSVAGRQVKKQPLNNYCLDVLELNPGLYFLIIEAARFQKIIKLLIVD